jgi:hypothetical protein
MTIAGNVRTAATLLAVLVAAKGPDFDILIWPHSIL